MNYLVHTPHCDAFRAAVRPHGILEEFACQRAAVARWQYERAIALTTKYEDESAEAGKYRNLALRWERSYNYAMRELRQLQTERAMANPNCHPPLANLEKIQRLAKRNGTPAAPPAAAAHETGDDAQVLSDEQCAERNPAHYPEVGRNSPCPCGSGKKYKRCCGVNAPPILYAA